MDPESKKLLEESLALAKDNNSMLHSMSRSMRVQRVMTAIYWLFIIGSAVGAYYFVQPYLDQIMDLYAGAIDVLKQFSKLSLPR